MIDRITNVERFLDNNPVKELNVYKDGDRWYARVVIERTDNDGVVQRFTLPRVMIPPVYAIVSEQAEGDRLFGNYCYYKLVLKSNDFVLTEGRDDEINSPVAFFVRESKRITRKEAEELLSRDGRTYIIVDEEDNDGKE